MRSAWQVFVALAVLALPLTAHAAEPVLGVDVGLGAQDVPGALLVSVQPRLALRLDRDAPISFDAWVGVHQSVFSPREGSFARGHAFDGAVGGDARTCSGSWCVGLRLALGAQYADYAWGDADIGDDPHASSTSAFVEVAPYLSSGLFSVALDARVHRLLDPPAHVGQLERFGGGLILGWQF